MKYEFEEKFIEVPENDCDITLRFPSGKEVVIQSRPSNADGDYLGSLDFILPENQLVTCWVGNDMKSAPAPNQERQHERLTKQIVTNL